MHKTLGSSNDPHEIKLLYLQAKSIIANPEDQSKLFSLKNKEAVAVETFVQNLSNSQIHTVGPELIFGTLFDRIGFNIIEDVLFRHFVISRIAYPTSKLKTIDYLKRYQGVDIDKNEIYRFLDKLQNKYKEIVEKVSYEHTMKVLKTLAIVFYDMTTLYFEAEDEDDLRKIGFSKDGKFQHPQILLGLLVGQGGYAIGYEIFEGNTFEGKTLIPILEKIQKKYGFEKPIVVADAGLLSKSNINELMKADYTFIVGSRIKNETDKLKSEILQKSQGIKNGDNFTIEKDDGVHLIVEYSEKRAKKDFYNREKGLKKLRLKIKSGMLSKEHISNRGYNKFLSLTGKINVTIDEEKVNVDCKWDGLKGYVTNTLLSPNIVVNHYRDLWQIEKAFRISKTDLRIRPIYHRIKPRIEAHICIVFVAYAIYKELERILKENKC